ncbi:unnamed protein product [Protopolystoma xenopodis]|uniref:Uncharacterized protein n=1 Tax=Protopolystoma xenopodis TaxID=117903 RepID=A0A3S5CB35_9PLAT|nr:unnamed protein product [Protopolystoma xenopodis]
MARANINEAAAPLGLFANLFRRFGVLVPGGGGDAAADGVMGGVAAAVAAEEDENNAGAAGIVDLLDLFYMFFRLGIVLAICAVYSSLEKTLVVIGVVLCVYIHNHLRERQMLRRQQEETERRRQDNQERQRLRPTSEASLSDSGPSASQDQLVTQPSHLEESNSQHSLNPETNVAEHIAVEVNADDAFQGPAAVDRLRAVAATSLQFVTTLITSIIPEPQAG